MNDLFVLLGIQSWKPILTAVALPPVPWLLSGLPRWVSVAIASCGAVAFAAFAVGELVLRSPAPHATLGQPGVLRAVLMAAGILVAIAGSAGFWLHGGRFASTDDAYVQNAKLVVTTDVSGVVATVNVHEGQAVKAGDLLRLGERSVVVLREL